MSTMAENASGRMQVVGRSDQAVRPLFSPRNGISVVFARYSGKKGFPGPYPHSPGKRPSKGPRKGQKRHVTWVSF
jgi:hypothetical protein